MSLPKPTYHDDAENNSSDGCTEVSGKRETNKSKKLFFFGEIANLLDALSVILMLTLKTIQYGHDNNLNEKFLQVQMIPHKDCNAKQFKNCFVELLNGGLIEFLEEKVGKTFASVHLMMKKGKPCLVFGLHGFKHGFNPAFITSMNYVEGFKLNRRIGLYQEKITYLPWTLQVKKKCQKIKKTYDEPEPEPEHDPVEKTPVPVVEHDKVDEPEQVEKTPVQKIDVVKPSLDSEVLDRIMLTTLSSYGKGNMKDDELFAIFQKLPTV